MSFIKKFWKFLSSMRFGILLLLLVVAACVVGSLIPQGKDFAYYIDRYPPRTAALIIGTCFDDVFHCGWFLVLAVVLCGNLLLCNLLRAPGLFRRWKNAGDPEIALKTAPTVTVEGVKDPEKVFSELRMPKARVLEKDGREVRFADKNRLGHWGAWVCHLGILLLILGVILGQTTKQEFVAAGLPGETVPLGETGYHVTVEAFDIEWNDSGMAKQYAAKLSMTSPSGDVQRGEASVNNPADLFGYRLYQNSYGIAARLRLMGEADLSRVLKPGESIGISQGDTLFSLVYRGYTTNSEGVGGYLYDFYGNDTLMFANGFQPEGDSSANPLPFLFSEPQYYTVLQVKRDNWTWLVLVGGLVTLLGLVLAFYLQPKRVWARKNEDGTWTLCGECRKGGALFADQLRKAAGAEDGGPAAENPE